MHRYFNGARRRLTRFLIFSFCSLLAPAWAEEFFVYVGTYTDGKSKGIYLFEFDSASGQLKPLGLAAEITSPSFLAVHPNRRFLYAANEASEVNGKPGGAVTAFAIDPRGGKLQLLNQQPSGGAGPCHLVVDRTGRNVLVANYGSGTVAVLPIESDGRLLAPSAVVQHTGSSVNPQRQKEPHAHSINLDRANRFAFAADLGVDKVFIYRFDSGAHSLAAHSPPAYQLKPGVGPRHFAFHPRRGFAFVINELDSTITSCSFNARTGELREIESVSTLPAGFSGGNSTAEVQVHPSGRFVYGSNRGHDSIAVFRLNEQSGRLQPVEHEKTGGRTPRNFGIDPTGSYLLAANQNSDTITVFAIDRTSGTLSPMGPPVSAPKPVCVKFVRR